MLFSRFVLPCSVLVVVAIIAQLVAGGCEQSCGEVRTATDAEASAVMAQDQPVSATDSTAPTDAAESASPHAAREDSGQHKHTNRLINETSPYLLQHAHNPVNWYAWGPEAFEAARAQDKPIFLSIGYSTCYWCHVMERESFEDEETAAIMNEHFISIKVDREERPDVDDIYMAAVQAQTGGGGWPMSSFLEPQSLKPFFGGTYFPRPRFQSLLNQMAQAWASQRDQVLQQADQVAQSVIGRLSLAATPQPLGSQQVQQAISLLLSSYDSQDAGFGRGRNKFPMPVYLDLLIGAGWDQPAVQQAVVHTLDRMATGGMYDQIGGGFHRYSTDTRWLVPHFEKMLYDNGQLASTYATAYERTNDAFYAEIVRETLDYVLREMTGPTGAFYSAQDAEVNAREGGNYIWVAQEIREALTDAGLAEDIDFTLKVYGFDRGTNFRDPHRPQDGPKNVVYLVDKPQVQASQMGMALVAFNERLGRVNAALRAVRDTRDQPGTDDKVLAGWNGLMIGGMADGSRVLNEPRYLDAATKAAAFVLSTMRTADGGLLRTYRSGQAKIDAFFEDYAFLIRGLIALHRANGESQPLQEAIELAGAARQRFWDEQSGGYFDTLAGQADLFVRTKSTYDGAVPCGNAVMLHNLLDLYELTGEQVYHDDAAACLQGLSGAISRSPVGSVLSVFALERFVDGQPSRFQTPAVPVLPQPDAVTARTSAQVVQLSAEEPTSFDVTLDIADGYHINAHNPGPAFLIPLNVRAVGGKGVKIHVDYPLGEQYQGVLAEGEMRIHRGTVTLPIQVEQVGPITGRTQLMLTYQVCTDKACLAPTTEALAVEITSGPQDQ